MLGQAMALAAGELLSFTCMVVLIVMSFSLMGYVAFGSTHEGFSSVLGAFMTCLEMVVGDFKYELLQEANPSVAPLFYLR